MVDCNSWGVLAFVCGGVLLPMACVVVRDWRIVGQFEPRICSGDNLYDLQVTSGGIYAHGTVLTCLLATTKAVNCTSEMIELYYPPINWRLAGASTEAVKTWAAGMSAARSFTCFVKPAAAGSTVHIGVSAKYDKMLGWVTMLVLGIIAWLGVIAWVCWTCWHK